MGDSSIHRYEGTDADVTWDQRLCIHAAECVRTAPGAFDVGRKPWVLPDGDDAARVREAVARCPSGALALHPKDGAPAEAPDAANTVRVVADGPLELRGTLRIAGAPADSPGLGLRATLCRCGRSANRPFCDNSHKEAGFTDPGAVQGDGPGAGNGGGELTVTPAANGPLLVAGDVAVVPADGSRAWRGAKGALCRCGHSANKPFCDGTHKRVGFTAPGA